MCKKYLHTDSVMALGSVTVVPGSVHVAVDVNLSANKRAFCRFALVVACVLFSHVALCIVSYP